MREFHSERKKVRLYKVFMNENDINCLMSQETFIILQFIPFKTFFFIYLSAVQDRL